MVTLERNRMTFRFPEVHPNARCRLEFQRTLRIPDDDRAYPLPAGLGRFPLRHLDDFADRLPRETRHRGGVVMPMHQAEAMWVNFTARGRFSYPCAVKIAAGKACAVSGEPWSDRLDADLRNYLTVPDQPWLDGYCVGKGIIRQFVAMPLGEGYTAEEQLTGAAKHGGLQVSVCPMKREVYEKFFGDLFVVREDHEVCYQSAPPAHDMGLAPGGRMRQDIYDDDYGLDAWDEGHASRCFVTIANSVQWLAITGERPPTNPPTARQYIDAGLPWFDYYDGDRTAISGSESLAALKSVAETGLEKHESPLPENDPLDVAEVVRLTPAEERAVREYPAAGNDRGGTLRHDTRGEPT